MGTWIVGRTGRTSISAFMRPNWSKAPGLMAIRSRRARSRTASGVVSIPWSSSHARAFSSVPHTSTSASYSARYSCFGSCQGKFGPRTNRGREP